MQDSLKNVHVLSPNCCSVAIFLNHKFINARLLPSCFSLLSEHVVSQSKWQSADLDPLKLAKKRKGVWPGLFRANVCIYAPSSSIQIFESATFSFRIPLWFLTRFSLGF